MRSLYAVISGDTSVTDHHRSLATLMNITDVSCTDREKDGNHAMKNLEKFQVQKLGQARLAARECRRQVKAKISSSHFAGIESLKVNICPFLY